MRDDPPYEQLARHRTPGDSSRAVVRRAADRLSAGLDQALSRYGIPTELVSELRRDLGILVRGLDVHAGSVAPVTRATAGGLAPVAEHASRSLARHAPKAGDLTEPADEPPRDSRPVHCQACRPPTPWPCQPAHQAAQALLVIDLLTAEQAQP